MADGIEDSDCHQNQDYISDKAARINDNPGDMGDRHDVSVTDSCYPQDHDPQRISYL